MTSFDRVRATGFHADLLERTVRNLNAGALPEYALFNLETSFDDDSVFRHLDYVGLSIPARQLVAMHLDELPTGLRWAGTVVPVKDVGPIEMAQVLLDPDDAGGATDGLGDELVLHLGLGANLTMDLDKVHCDDPECEYDHGFSGLIKRDGLVMRFDDAAQDGSSSSAAEAFEFIRELTAAIARAAV